MKIFGICLVKNEGDIIHYSLSEAAKWADKIYVLDNGSVDDTWKIVCSLAQTNPVIIPWKQTYEPYDDGLRADVFNHFRSEAKAGDWWCMKMDADEFYVEEPRVFLTTKVRAFYHAVCSKHIQYRVTTQDLDWIDNPKLSVQELIERLHYYEPMATSEIRFFKHRPGLVWKNTDAVPARVGLVCPERILVRHYQYRTTKQIEDRITLRFQGKFPHITSPDWRSYILAPDACLEDRRLIRDYREMPVANNRNLKYRWWVFWIKRFLYATSMLP